MKAPTSRPEGWFGSKGRRPLPMKLVSGPVPSPSEAEVFPFWLSVVLATAVLAVGAVGARFWIIPAFFGPEEEIVAPVVRIRTAEKWEEKEPEREARVARVEPAQPFAPRVVAPIPIPAVQPEELVQAEWERPADEPYDPSELLEEAEVPFPPVSEEPEVTKSTRRESSPKERRPAPRIKPSKPVTKGPSHPVRVLRRYQPPYPRSARRAGTEGRVLLSVQVRSDGRVGSVRVSQSSGSAILDSAAVSAVKRWSFEPERKNGRAVATTVNVPFRFSLE